MSVVEAGTELAHPGPPSPALRAWGNCSRWLSHLLYKTSTLELYLKISRFNDMCNHLGDFSVLLPCLISLPYRKWWRGMGHPGMECPG